MNLSLLEHPCRPIGAIRLGFGSVQSGGSRLRLWLEVFNVQETVLACGPIAAQLPIQ